MQYLMHEATAEEMAAEDPFGGDGVFLALPGAGNSEILGRMERVFGGTLPAVTWPDRGAWVNAAAVGTGPEILLAHWENR